MKGVNISAILTLSIHVESCVFERLRLFGGHCADVLPLVDAGAGVSPATQGRLKVTRSCTHNTHTSLILSYYNSFLTGHTTHKQFEIYHWRIKSLKYNIRY